MPAIRKPRTSKLFLVFKVLHLYGWRRGSAQTSILLFLLRQSTDCICYIKYFISLCWYSWSCATVLTSICSRKVLLLCYSVLGRMVVLPSAPNNFLVFTGNGSSIICIMLDSLLILQIHINEYWKCQTNFSFPVTKYITSMQSLLGRFIVPTFGQKSERWWVSHSLTLKAQTWT